MEVELDTKEIEALLRKLADKLTDMTPAFADLGEELVVSTKARFDSSTAPDGTPWAPNSEHTIARYKGGGTKKPLIGESKGLSETIHFEAGADYVEWGSGQIYAAVQQFGAEKGAFGTFTRTFGEKQREYDIPFGTIPARPYIGLSEDDRDTISEVILEFLKNLK